ncbi:MAG: hypothetical protein HZB46_13220 [Solirubrobacterales bacterium]|nr:hypothetical protein [Solirubrobacterales bacterium]
MAGPRTVSLAQVRAAGRFPQIALSGLAIVLSAVGLRALVAPAPEPARLHSARSVPVDPALEGLAEAFARWFTGPRSERDPALAQRRFGLAQEGVADDRGSRSGRPVRWSAVVASARRAREAVVTVALDDGRATTYLAVTTGRDQRGRLYVAGPPAVVGPPRVADGRVAPAELEVEDPALRTVAVRVLRHYLAGEAVDLDADLEPGAAVSLPTTGLRVADVVATTWVVRQRRVALLVLARSRDGQQLTLRYELDVVRHGRRWLVRRVHVNPMALEATR